MSITKANQKIRKLRMFSSMLSITNSSLKLPSPFKAQDQQKADEEAEKTKKEGKSQNEGQPNNDEVGHDNEKVLDCFYEMVNKQEHNYNKCKHHEEKALKFELRLTALWLYFCFEN